MMRILILLILTSTLAFSQRRIEKKTLFHKSFVKTSTAKGESECSDIYIKLYIGKRKLLFESDLVNLDLKILKKKTDWLAENKEGVIYDIKAFRIEDELGMMIIPRSLTLKGVMIIRNKDLCH